MRLSSRENKLNLLGLLFVFLVVVACRGSNAPTTQRPSATHFPNATLTWSPTVEPTTTVPPTIVWTPLPTLSPDEAESRVLDLLQYNAGCSLPCWWGITPGETSASTAIQFLSTFTDLATVLGTPGNEHSAVVEQGAAIDYVGSSYRIFGNYGSTDYTFQDGLVDTISANYGGGTGDHRAEMYQLSRILSSNGEPGEIWVSAAPNSPLGNTADLYLFYGQQGIFVHYLYQDLVVSADKMEICPFGVGPEELKLWSPSAHRYAGFADYYFSHPVSWPPIETALGMDRAAFYRAFKNPADSLCFETPLQFWDYVPPTVTH
jgi:hypothetical protein